MITLDAREKKSNSRVSILLLNEKCYDIFPVRNSIGVENCEHTSVYQLRNTGAVVTLLIVRSGTDLYTNAPTLSTLPSSQVWSLNQVFPVGFLYNIIDLQRGEEHRYLLFLPAETPLSWSRTFEGLF